VASHGRVVEKWYKIESTWPVRRRPERRVTVLTRRIGCRIGLRLLPRPSC